MPLTIRTIRRLVPLGALVVGLLCTAAAAGAGAIERGPLETAVMDPAGFTHPTRAESYAAVSGAGAKKVRLMAAWSRIAPVTRPASFDPTNPGDPAYRWSDFDAQVTGAVAAGLEPIVNVLSAPSWAERGTVGSPGTRDPDPAALGAFARAAAARYSGTFGGLPRVRFWVAWNEPNLDLFLMPQFNGDTPVSPGLYRALLGAFAQGVRAVHADNVVVAGTLTPFGDAGRAVWPLHFMRELLCVSADAAPAPTCSASVPFDVWAQQPYSNGGPLWQAWHPDGGSLGDLPRMRNTLDAAVRAGHVAASDGVRFWVTEFSWDTAPPDASAVPIDLHVRWVSEALYRMWRNDVSLVTWFTLRDEPLTDTMFQSGLYFWDGTRLGLTLPKPSLQAFRFPFVALPENGRAFVWGRTPDSRPAYVAIEALVDGAWMHFSVLRANRHGIFMGRVPIYLPANLFRVRHGITNDTSVPFSLEPPPNNDLVLVTPFGQP